MGACHGPLVDGEVTGAVEEGERCSKQGKGEGLMEREGGMARGDELV